MFDSMVEDEVEPGVMSGDQLAAAIVDNHTELLRRECRVLELACAWADFHDQIAMGIEYAPLVERACMFGGPGTPMVSEFCVTELGALQGTGPMAARSLVADALDLRYRLPMLWRQVQAGQVRAWQARKVAEQTRPLSWDACVELDAALSGFLGMMTWSRFQTILTAAILDADPELAKAREERARQARDVWACDSDDGLKTLIAKATSGDVVWFLATINRIADILAADGDSDPVGVRRSKAIGILAQPAQALALLAAHRDDPTPTDLTEPAAEEDRDQSSDDKEDRGPSTSSGSGAAGSPSVGLSQSKPNEHEDSSPSTSSGHRAAGSPSVGLSQSKPNEHEDSSPSTSSGSGAAGSPTVGLSSKPNEPEDSSPSTRSGSGAAGSPSVGLSLSKPNEREDSGPSTSSGHRAAGSGHRAAGAQHRSLIVDPPVFGSLDVKRLRPRVVLHFHLSDTAIRTRSGLVRPEYGTANTLNQLKEWLAETGCTVTVQPVFDPADVAPVDAYEIQQRTRDAVRLRNLADVFPYGSCTTATMDLDHTKPYLPMDRGGPPGQTSLANLGPMTRHHHRAVTHGGWGKRQPAPGQYLFRSPKGYLYLVTNQGTLPLGRTAFAQAIWRAATELSTDTA